MIRWGWGLVVAVALTVLARPCIATVWSRPEGPLAPETVLATEVIWGTSCIAIGFMNLSGRPGAEHPHIMSLVGLGLAAGSLALRAYECNEAPQLDTAAAVIGIFGSFFRMPRVREALSAPPAKGQNGAGAGRVCIGLAVSPQALELRLRF